MAENFEKCLAITLVWEGGYSNHPDDPGGPTMRGVIQREYDKWRREHGQSLRPVRQIDDAELRAIYRANYWDAMECDGLPPGVDLAVFDAAVNSGIGRARQWLAEAGPDVGKLCDVRLAFLQRLGKLWRVFGVGWRRRVEGIRQDGRSMAGLPVNGGFPDDGSLHAGMKGPRVLDLQTKLRGLGYPVAVVDGIFGEQTRRAVILFQEDNDLHGEAGIWRTAYDPVLAEAGPMLPGRADKTAKDLEATGDKPIAHMNLLQRIFAWLFGGAAAAQVFDGSSVADSVAGLHDALEPVRGVLDWVTAHHWALLAVLFVVAICLVRLIRAHYVKAFQTMGYQGPATPAPGIVS